MTDDHEMADFLDGLPDADQQWLREQPWATQAANYCWADSAGSMWGTIAPALLALRTERDRLAALAEARHRVINRLARESSSAEAAVEGVRDWLSQWGPKLPDGACHTLDQVLDGPPDRSTAAAIDETYCYEPPNCQCGHGAEYHGPEAGCIECRCSLAMARAVQADGERTTPNNPPASSDTVDLSGHDVRCPSCRELLGQFIKTEAQAGILVADHTC